MKEGTVARKSAYMLRPGKHRILVLGGTYDITSISHDGEVLIFTLTNEKGEIKTIRRTPGVKIEVAS